MQSKKRKYRTKRHQPKRYYLKHQTDRLTTSRSSQFFREHRLPVTLAATLFVVVMFGGRFAMPVEALSITAAPEPDVVLSSTATVFRASANDITDAVVSEPVSSLASSSPTPLESIASSEPESAPEPTSESEPEPDPVKVLPPVPDSAPDATAELVATSVFFEHLESYPHVTIDELISFGDAIEAPLYYAEPIDYTEDDLLWLARIIDREAGSDRYPDILQLLVGNVVLNRVASIEFPDTIKAVLFTPKAYGPNLAAEHLERKTPSARALENAKRLLDGQRFCPPSVIFQANGKQGKGIFLAIDDELSGRVSYFCYAYHMQKYEA